MGTVKGTTPKQDAIKEITKIFKGNDAFISQCVTMIASTQDFKGIDSYDIQNDNWSWEKLLRLTILFNDHSFKQLHYRKGNNKYAGKNKTSDIHDYSLAIIDDKTEKFKWDA